MKSSYKVVDYISSALVCKLVCLSLLLFLFIDSSRAIALPYPLDGKSKFEIFKIDSDKIQMDKDMTGWTEVTNFGIDQPQTAWRLAPYPTHIDGALYYALIFHEESIFVSQEQPEFTMSPNINILPIPECPTLILMGIGLLGLSAYIRSEFIRKKGVGSKFGHN